jgi:hypothetical protein
MWVTQAAIVLWRMAKRYWHRLSWDQQLKALALLLFLTLIVGVIVSSAVVDYQFNHLPNETQLAAHGRAESYAQMQRNLNGQASDPFTCSTSTENKPIASFDNGKFWWVDDGRCRTRQQRVRDADAATSSYLSTTLRVDTDMDSFWLPDEERTCQTFPDEKGRVSVVACNQTGNHRDHNIPVKFWGGVERNTVSSWKCRREKDLLTYGFVCRAVD